MMDELGTLSAKEIKLNDLLREFPDNFYVNSPIPYEYEDTISDIILAGRENGWTDEFIRICEANSGSELNDVVKLIYTPERFPLLEIYDDDTGEILGYGYEGNFLDGQDK